MVAELRQRCLARIWPDGIAARMAVTVVLALLLTQMVSAAVYLTGPGETVEGVHPLLLIHRAAALVRIVEALPPAERLRVVQAFDDPVLRVEWQREKPEMGKNRHDFPFDRLRHRLQSVLGDPHRPVFIEVKRPSRLVPPSTAVLPAGMSGTMTTQRDDDHTHMGHTHIGTVRVALPLVDGSWLVFTASDERTGPFNLVRFLVWMGLIGVMIALLSLWAARRLTAPLARFAAAAERFGVEADAAPLPESGPRELRVATHAFNRMQERLRRFIDDRTRMIAAISHDLRTPLTRLRLRAETIEDPEQQRKILADLAEMQAMIEATLAFARDDARKEPRTTVDLAELLCSLCEDRVDAGLLAEYQGPTHYPFACRPVALRRALGNLIDNALAYGEVARVSLEQTDAGHVTIRIDDDGPGIPQAEWEKVFIPFYRLETSRSRDTGGTGLGLSVARTVLRGHGGDIALQNRPEGGLRVLVTLPRT